MKNIFTNVLLAGVIIVFALPMFAHAQTSSSVPKNLTGYAWSSTIGWVSLTCENTGTCATSDYWVGVKNNGNIEGYAWSSNIGWISFNGSDTNGCPFGSCQATLNDATGQVSGWAKALAGGSAQSGGWDGWIYLGQTPRVGVNVSGCTWSGKAWGGGADSNSGVIGWLSFGGPGYSVTGSGAACAGNDGVDLTAGSVVATPQNNGSEMLIEVPITNNGGDDVTGGIDIRVQIAINSTYSQEFDLNLDENDAITNLTAGNFKTASYVWNNPPSGTHDVRVCVDQNNEIAESNEDNNCGPRSTIQVDRLGLAVSCSADPTSAGTGALINWTADVDNTFGQVTYTWSGDQGLSGSGTSVSKRYNSQGTKSATITVEAENGTVSDTCTVSITQGGGGGDPATAALSASPNEILLGESATLTWSSTNASSCTGVGFNTGNATSGTAVVTPTSDAIYQVQCGSASDNASVEVLLPNISITADGESGSVRVPNQEVVTIEWSAEDITSCDVVGPGILVNNATDDPLNGDADVTITSRSVYTITCDASSETFTESVTVNIPPDFEEF
ncbi:MAG: CARDB domain-containing protein [Patescibacteria group bacterium UBA2103]